MTATTTLRVVESHARRYRHTWRSSVITTFVNPVLMLSAMGLGLGSLVDDNGGLGDITYLAFLGPGLMVATAMQIAAGEASFPVMAGMQWIKSYDAALATPVTVGDLLMGQLGWATIRLAQTIVTFALVEVLFGAVTPAGGAASMIPAMVTGLAFLTPVAWYTAGLESDNGLATLFRFGIVPLFLFSGTFFPISQLPEWMRPIAYFTPLWHGVEWARDWALGLPSPWPWWGHAAFLFTVAGVGLAGAFGMFQRKLVT
jgi:lipooligosaccharide transport system permease protein